MGVKLFKMEVGGMVRKLKVRKLPIVGEQRPNRESSAPHASGIGISVRAGGCLYEGLEKVTLLES